MSDVMTMTLSTLFVNIISIRNKDNNYILEFIDYYDVKNKDIFKIIPSHPDFPTIQIIQDYIIDEFKDQIQFGNIVRKSNMISNIIFNKLTIRSFEIIHKLDKKYKNLEDYEDIKFNMKSLDSYDYISILNKELRERCNIVE